MAAPPPPTSTSTSTSTPTQNSTTSPPPPRTLRIGTRSSALALAQCALFTQLLPPPSAGGPTTTTIIPTTTSLGDTDKQTALHTLASAGKSLWTEDLEHQLHHHTVDVLVHSMKDVPTQLAHNFRITAVGPRDEARDAVVMSARRAKQGCVGLGDLGAGAVVGTSSVRRAAMVRRRYPGLEVRDVRGNVGTRLAKLDDEGLGYDAVVLAGAGVQRLGLGGRVGSWLGREEGVLHAVGQGALGVEWRVGDAWVEGLVGGMGRGRRGRRVRWECVAERGVLRALEGGCSVPVGVECVWEEEGDVGASGPQPTSTVQPAEEIQTEPNSHVDDADAESAGGHLTMRAMVVSLDGQECVEGSQRHYVGSDADAEECAMKLYRELVEKGAEKILREITLNRGMIKGLGGA